MRPLTLRTVLVATDLDRLSDTALDSAHRLAAAAGAALHVVHVREPQEAEDAGAVWAVLRRAGVPEASAKLHLIPGSPAETIRSLADRMAADVIVVGPHRERRHGTPGDALGGTARAIAERAYAPCLIAAQALPLPLERVVVPIDLSDTARGALLVGLSWTSALRAGAISDRETTLTVLHVDTVDEDIDKAPARSFDRELATLREDAADWAGVVVRGTRHKGADAAQAVADYATNQDADLVVLGTRGLGLDDMPRLGSVSAAITTRVRKPMLLVPPAVWRAHAAVP
jgi:nucleotide-binding universal stress UspA family protein